MGSVLVYGRIKSNMIVSPRDVLIVIQEYTMPDGTVYLGSASVDHPDYPPFPKLVRVNTIFAGNKFVSIDGGKSTHMTFITEYDIGGGIPKYLSQKVSMQNQFVRFAKLDELLAKEAA